MSHTPRKRFGQNFLQDKTVVQRIVASVGPTSGDHVVEIGPGEGAMTQAFLAEDCRLDAIEIDRDLASILKSRFSQSPNFNLHMGDALRFDFSSLSQGKKLRVVGNLPYNISTPLMFHLFEQHTYIEDMHFMLQKEVVDRLCADSGDDDYGRLSIMAQYHCTTEKLFEVYPESFFPMPKVTSAIVRLIPHEKKPLKVDPKLLGKIVSTAFSQRRKTLRNSLKSLFNEKTLSELNIDPNARAETLSLKQYGQLALYLTDHPEP